MRIRIITTLAIAILCLAPTASWADLAPYSQDFEGLDQGDPGALAGDGWLVFANVFGPDFSSYWYGYGSFPAPNGTPGFSSVASGEGGPAQGMQQLVTYSDYNNQDHGNILIPIIEGNVFQEQTIGAADVGTTWRFEFDAKLGDIAGNSMAGAFFKTVDPADNFALTNYFPIELAGISDLWGTYEADIFITPDLEGQLLQFGFINWASSYEPSGMLYDNVNFDLAPLAVSVDVKPGSCPNPINGVSRGVVPVAVLGTMDFDVNMIDVDSLQLQGVSPLMSDYEDVAEPFQGDNCGCAESYPDGFTDLTLKFRTQEILAVLGSSDYGVYTLTLTGTLLDGTAIEGQDCVVMVGGGNRDGFGRSASDGRPALTNRVRTSIVDLDDTAPR